MESNLGNALVALNLEDKFISNVELSGFSLIERSQMVNSIVDEKLRLGKWKGVIQMMYGEFSNAGALYDGDLDELKDDIVKSAKEHTSTYFGQEILYTLSNAKEYHLLFQLATNALNLNYDEFSSVIDRIGPDYFNDSEEGAQRKQILHQTRANKAMEERKYDLAYSSFVMAKDNEGIDEVFETTLACASEFFCGRLLEKIVIGDPTQKNERLRRIVLSSISEEGGLKPLEAFGFFKKYDVSLSTEEKTTLQERVAESASRYDVKQTLFEYPEEKLLWAKKHAKDEPKTAYRIFNEQEFEGEEVTMAVEAGLSMEKYENEEIVLETSDVSEPHLRSAYESASFNVQVKIASHLKNSEKLQELSRQAHVEGNLDKAYSLWVSGNGDLDENYISAIRTALIEDGLENHSGSMYFLNNSDVNGMTEAYNTLMETDKGERTDNLRQAYRIALNLKDKERTHRAREEMVDINPEWAISKFTNQTGDNDEEGLNYALETVASRYGVEKEELKHYFEKYRTG